MPAEEYRNYFSEFVTANVADVEAAKAHRGVTMDTLKERIQEFVECSGGGVLIDGFFNPRKVDLVGS